MGAHTQAEFPAELPASSFGPHSEDGSHFVKRVLTAVTTLRQQQRDVLDYLTEACAATMRGDKAPSLLPDASIIQSGA